MSYPSGKMRFGKMLGFDGGGGVSLAGRVLLWSSEERCNGRNLFFFVVL